MKLPIKNAVLKNSWNEGGDITQFFGQNNPIDYKKWGLKGHNGLDLVNKNNPDDSIYSVEKGVLIKQEYKKNSYGNLATVWNKENSRAWAYAHLANFDNALKVGSEVKEGQRIGKMGNTGNSSGKHLHLELIPVDKNGVRTQRNNGYGGVIDPLPFLKNINNNMKNYLEVNKKIIEDFTKHHSDVFGSRTADYIHLETKIAGEGIRERFRVLIRKIRDLRGREIPNSNLIQKELKKVKEENEMLTSDIVNNINACNIDKANLNEQIEKLQKLNGKWAKDFNGELEKAKNSLEVKYLNQIRELQKQIQNTQSFDFNKLFIGISRWWTSEGGSDLVLGGVLSLIIALLPSLLQLINQNVPEEIIYFSILPLLNSLVATFRKNSSKEVIKKYESQIDNIEAIIKNNKIK